MDFIKLSWRNGIRGGLKTRLVKVRILPGAPNEYNLLHSRSRLSIRSTWKVGMAHKIMSKMSKTMVLERFVGRVFKTSRRGGTAYAPGLGLGSYRFESCRRYLMSSRLTAGR